MMGSGSVSQLRGKGRLLEAESALMQGAAYFGGGFVLSAAKIWGQMQPVAIGLTVGSGGWKCVCAAVGSALGYRLLWGDEGIQGMIWAAGSLILALILPMLETGRALRAGMAAGAASIVSAVCLAFTGGTSPWLLLLRMVLAGCCGYFGYGAVSGRDRAARWMGLGLGVLSLASLSPWLGWGAAGAFASGSPLPGALMAALGSDLANPGVALTGAVSLGFFLQRMPVERPMRLWLAPALGCILWMALQHKWQPGMAICFACGSVLGAWLPMKRLGGGMGYVQVRLEQTAQVLHRLQHQLLDYSPPEPDREALLHQLRQSSCDLCDLKGSCQMESRMSVALLESSDPLPCPRPELGAAELRRSREQLKRIRAARVSGETYRLALVQQYGFLADALHNLADRVADRSIRQPRFRVQVSARSGSRESADGDRICAFAGGECRYYVVLCDGMGTGTGAAEESRRAMLLIRQMIQAGMTPESVLGSLNSQLSLTDRGGAVTVDLAELRLESGRVWLYKWGAGPSWLLKRRRAVMLGASGPPPGLGVNAGRETVSHAAMTGGEILLMLSDGVQVDNLAEWSAMSIAADLPHLAQRILKDGSTGQDDATVAVVRMVAD